mmetsp:Transcript_16588/g.55315  ORF Transcript_16588/g.55315 Transcript_16588/m.55315 type:complete len:126 (-) Transcript_16588:844-1221(-)
MHQFLVICMKPSQMLKLESKPSDDVVDDDDAVLERVTSSCSSLNGCLPTSHMEKYKNDLLPSWKTACCCELLSRSHVKLRNLMKKWTDAVTGRVRLSIGANFARADIQSKRIWEPLYLLWQRHEG